MSAPTTEQETGRVYWRSLDELEQTPEFRQWLEREFPEGASEWTDPVSRRHFTKIMSASFLLAGLGLTGCRRPEQRIVPFGQAPDSYLHGVPQYFATAMPTRTGAIPLVVKSHDGRPTKVEGNRLHPDSNGSTDRFAQASILNLYDPDRATRFRKGPDRCAPEEAFDYLAKLAQEIGNGGGKGLAVLLEHGTSPSRNRLLKDLARKCPQTRFYYSDAVDTDIHRRAASTAFGKALKPRWMFDKADVVLSLDCDFLGSEDDIQNHIRRFSKKRQIEKPGDVPNRLYVVESLMTVTGFSAEHRLRAPSSTVVQVAAGIAAGLPVESAVAQGLKAIGAAAGVDPKWISECANDLAAHKGRSLVVAGHRQPMAVHLLAWAMNAALGNIGQTVLLQEAAAEEGGALGELAQALNGGEVDTLVMLGGNPAYTAAADLDWAKAQRKAKTVVRLGYYEDETSDGCDWHLPMAHYLESWGDALAGDGSLVPVQPLIAPLFGGLTELDVLARISGVGAMDSYSIVRETFKGFVGEGDLEGAWKRFLHDGSLAGSAAKPVPAQLQAGSVAKALSEIKLQAPGKDSVEVVFHRDHKVDDGRFNNNGWLQELPDPVTKIVWDNAILISRRTARELGLKNQDVVEVKLGDRVVQGPIWVQPGMADYSLGLALGYGREKTGRVGVKTGFNAYKLRTTAAGNFVVGATVRATGATYPISCTQTHWSMEGRPIIREANLKQYQEHPDFVKAMAPHEPPVVAPMYPNPLDKASAKALHQWGMSIDLNRCVGCSACVVACQSENNVPIVGKDQVNRGREMHWLRIDRYYTGRPLAPKGSKQAEEDFLQTHQRDSEQQFNEWIDNPQTVTQPMLCQHCEAAPCENVCPVNATSHDKEGLNVMTYNRCVGTRYCSNNCPYKVRRFNFFDYNKRPIGELYWGPFGKRKEDEWDLIRMIKNPDVTVRMRGVMEKCTFCLQRIEQAKISRKVKAGESGEVVVPDGTFTTACAQACPAEAIVFGNIKDPESQVAKKKSLDRDYTVLQELFTRPRTSYLAKVRNPNPAMPDYTEAPFSFREFEQRMGNPFEHGGGKHEAAAGAHANEKGAH